jgi:hypothetical protein
VLGGTGVLQGRLWTCRAVDADAHSPWKTADRFPHAHSRNYDFASHFQSHSHSQNQNQPTAHPTAHGPRPTAHGPCQRQNDASASFSAKPDAERSPVPVPSQTQNGAQCQVPGQTRSPVPVPKPDAEPGARWSVPSQTQNGAQCQARRRTEPSASASRRGRTEPEPG